MLKIQKLRCALNSLKEVKTSRASLSGRGKAGGLGREGRVVVGGAAESRRGSEGMGHISASWMNRMAMRPLSCGWREVEGR